MASPRHIPTGIYHIRHAGCGTSTALCGYSFGKTPPILLTQQEEQINQICVVCEEMAEQKCLVCGGIVNRQRPREDTDA